MIHRIRESRSRGRASPWVLLSLSLLIVLAVVAALTLGPRLAENSAPGIVARVNGDEVTLDELVRVQADLLEIRRLQGQPGDKDPEAEEFERVAVQSLIQRHLMLQEAGRRKLSVGGDDLDAAIAELRDRFEDLETFGAWMEERGLGDRSLFETVRGDILTNRVTAALIEDVQLSEEQVSEYYEANKEDLIIAQEVRLQIIVVDSVEAGDAIRGALSEGLSFSHLARELSRGARAAEGGDTGWVDLATLAPPLRQVVDKLQQGEAYGPVEKNPDEFLVVALAGRRSVHAKSLDEARQEIERRLLPLKQQQAIQEWLEEQQEQAEIEVF